MVETLISVCGAVIVCLINNHCQQERFEAQQKSVAEEAERKHDETIRMIEYKLDQLTKKVELHNNAVERLYAVETKTALAEEKMKVANHRIDDLERGRS
ncbi:hypothetical protein [Mogibacterium kristiansenii]|uniref:Uncharacterized protein n=1 Tax=Mogibacterium kristiansenii TaxID=2606708 RepID=A0A6N7XM16_9FIRM|nr:hypothetical protein [Mogibacterium kristiansenii]MST70631.1 hypothetical protein [Mogibacterium kristiansenii]